MEKIKVWDLPTRLFHWTIVVLVGVSWGTAELGWMNIHQWSGITVLTLIIFRVAWGFLGSTTSRFSNFVRSPQAAIDYLKVSLKSENKLYAGHNPLGAWAVIALLLLLAFQASTGLFAHDDILFKGPLAYMVSKGVSSFLTEVHELTFDLIIVVAGGHIAAVFFYLLVKRQNLIRPMVTGDKDEDQVPPGTNLRFESTAFAIILLALSAALVWWIIK
jgi:cytochrome b